MSRREALELLGLTAAAAAMPGTTGAQTTTFPKGAVIMVDNPRRFHAFVPKRRRKR